VISWDRPSSRTQDGVVKLVHRARICWRLNTTGSIFPSDIAPPGYPISWPKTFAKELRWLALGTVDRHSEVMQLLRVQIQSRLNRNQSGGAFVTTADIRVVALAECG
jgi:hypothetical protein